MEDFLVTTTRGMFLVENGIPRKVADGWCFGLTWDRERLYVADGLGGQGEVHAWSPSFERGECLLAPVHDAHQILWWDGDLYATNTAENRIDVAGKGHVKWTDDNIHLNSVWCDGERFWVVEHRRGVMPARVRAFDLGWKEERVEEFYKLDTSHYWGLHNAYVEGGILHTLSTRRMIARPLAGGEEERTVVGGYLRGLARGDMWYVGKSRLSERQTRNEGNGSVLLLDDDFQIVEEVLIPDCGQVHDIRLMAGGPAHNGLPFPGYECN